MKAILTKIIPCTNTKPTRIKAYTEGGNSLTLSYNACDTESDGPPSAHLTAAQSLCRKMQWTGELIGGGTPDGYCFVFAQSTIRSKKGA